MMDTNGQQPTTTSTPDQAGSWAQAGADEATGGQGAQQALEKAQHPNPETQPQTQTPDLGNTAHVGGQVPLVLRPKQAGLAGIVGKIADVLTGTTRPEIFTDEGGNEFVYHPNLSRGQQWARVGAELFHGAAAGLAAGKGAGNMGRGALAGYEAGEQEHQQRKDEETQLDAKAQQDMMNRANMTMLRMNMAEQAWRAARLQTVANQQDAEFSQKTVQFLHSMGGQVIGIAAHPWDLGTVLKVSPELAKDFVQRHIIEPVATIDPEGHKGVTFMKMPNADWRNQVATPGATFHTFNPSTHELDEHKASDAMSEGERFDLDSKAFGDQLKYQNDVREQELKKAQTKNLQSEEEARRKETPSKIAEQEASAAEHTAQAKKLNTEAVNEGEDSPLVDAMGTGHITAERMGYVLTKNPGLLQQVVKKYPGFDSAKAEAYPALYKDFTSGKVSVQINAGDVALKHLKELRALNTVKSHIPHSDAWTAYQNKADTVAAELARFYGDETIPGIAAIKATLASTLPGNRESAIRTQIQSMGDKIDSFENQWKRGAPSAAYEAAMPGLSLEAKEARASFDPAYANRLIIKMKAPNGDVSDVPYAQVKFYQQKGATVIDQ